MFKRRRTFRSGRRARPLLRWTAVNPGAHTFHMEDEVTDSENIDVLVTPDVYQQNELLEPDGATLKRVILDFWHIAVIGNTATADSSGVGVFFDHAIIVHDTNADMADVLSSSNWSDTMIKERVLWYGSYDYVMMQIAGQGGLTMRSIQLSPSQDLVALPHQRVDFRVQAKLQQNKQVSFLSRITAVGLGANLVVDGNYRMQSRILIGGKF